MGHAFQSPLRRSDVLSGVVESCKAELFVEVGTKEGKTTGALLENFPTLRAIAIDPWSVTPNGDEDYSGWDFAAIEQEFWQNMRGNRDRVEMWRTTSDQAAKRMTRKADVVFIDAAHDYENCLADILAWWPHVRDNGYLCGHDYQHKFPGVMRAVAKAFPLLRIAVCPDSVWIAQKDADLKLKVAA